MRPPAFCLSTTNIPLPFTQPTTSFCSTPIAMNSENAQAMSAQDWLLDDDQLQVAARISLTNASSTTDVKKRRQDAILAARHFDAKHPTADKSAAERFLDVSELVTLVFRHLVYDRIDLTTLSKVSKRCRSIALPLLVECLNIPFTKSGTFSALFDSNPGLIAHVKFLRLWDDVAEATKRTGQSDPAHKLVDADWAKLGKLLAQFEAAGLPTLPLLELSLGQAKLCDVYAQLLKAPRLLGRLASLQIIDDVDPAPDLADSSEFEAGLTESMTLLLSGSCNQQHGAGTPYRKLAILGPRPRHDDYTRSSLPVLRPQLLEKLSSDLTHLELNITVGFHNLEAVQDLLRRQWPKLESVRLELWDEDIDEPILSEAFGALVASNPSIRHICAEVHTEQEQLMWQDQVQFDQLATVSFAGVESAPGDIEFAKRNNGLRDLTMDNKYAGWAIAGNEDVMRSLCVLRAPAPAVDDFLRRKNQLREVHITHGCWDVYRPDQDGYGSDEEEPFDPLDSGIQASNVTFLALPMEGMCSFWTIRSFPNVVELAIIYRDTIPRRAVVFLGGSSHRLERIFARLREAQVDQVSKLRALLIKSKVATPLPVAEDGLVADAFEPPSRLDYVTLLTGDRDVQHFRVLPSSDPNERTARLQILPAIFRPKVDRKTGFWEDVFDSRHGYALFDHLTDDEPRL
ncbi:hypothetical protein V8E36_008034, partial [Tilletia maclaganii]